MLQLGEEALDEVALTVEPFAEAGLPAPVALWRDVGRRALILDQGTDAVSVVSFVCQQDSARAEVIERRVSDLPVMRLSCR